MVVALAVISFAERLQQFRPTLLNRRDHCQRAVDRQSVAVRKIRPGRLVIRIDRRPILGQRQLAARVSHGVAVRQMMHYLDNRPAAFPVGCVELFLVQSGDGCSQPFRQHLQRMDLRGADAGKAAGRWCKAANWVAEVVQICHGMSPVSSLW